MEKIERDFHDDDFYDLDDVLDRSFFSDEDDMPDLEDDESDELDYSNNFRPISEL